MQSLKDFFRPIAIVFGLIFLGLSIYLLLKSILLYPRAGETVTVDYANVVVILLTTVTVLFTIAALALAVAAFYGYQNIRDDATKAADKAIERKLNAKISTAFKVGGAAFEEIRGEITDEDSAMGRWLRNEIEREVTKQVIYGRAEVEVDEDDDTDEGIQE